MLYYAYMAGFGLAKIVPLRGCYFIAELIARTWYLFAARDKMAMRNNLRTVLGSEVSAKEIERHILSIFRNFAKYLVDFFRFPRFSEEYITTNICVEGRENLDRCISEGKGAIAVTVHLGNWELGAALVGGMGYKLSAIALQHANKRINDFFTNQRSINGVRSIPTGTSVRGCFKSLAKNEVIAIAADKDYTSTGVRVEFFGKKALLPKGAAVISLRTGAPIVFTLLTREEGDKFKLRFEKPVKPEPTGDSEGDIRRLMAEYVKYFEKYIRAYPDQWYAFREIWDQK
jgi:Kdo2-lipid IVA lauroyltransferase/acyltransferase